jgi:hypothetical protein
MRSNILNEAMFDQNSNFVKFKVKTMFVILLTYKKSLEDIDEYLAEHRAFLDNGYRDNFFVASGPKNP